MHRVCYQREAAGLVTAGVTQRPLRGTVPSGAGVHRLLGAFVSIPRPRTSIFSPLGLVLTDSTRRARATSPQSHRPSLYMQCAAIASILYFYAVRSCLR